VSPSKYLAAIARGVSPGGFLYVVGIVYKSRAIIKN